MSEYQYYEFQAVDRPLTREEMAGVRAMSTRATITPTSFENTYDWGSFRGNPLAMVERYYDAFLYTTNWGTHRLMLRLPRSILDPETASRYCVEEEAFSRHLTPDHVILIFDSNDEESEDWDEGQGWLSTLVLLRADIANGDLRCLYLGWLMCVQEEILDNDVIEPPVPPGLGDLSGSLETLVRFLRIDQDLLKAAAEDSPALSLVVASTDEIQRWLRTLSVAEKDNLLLRLASSDLQPLRVEVRRRIRESGDLTAARGITGQGRTVGDLLELAGCQRQERERQQARERERQKQEQAAARAAYLDRLAGREDQLWREVESLVSARRPSEYPQSVRLLTDLRDLAVRQHKYEDFQARLADLQARHSGKRRFLGLLNEAGLRPTQAMM